MVATNPSVAIHSGKLDRRLVDLADERFTLMDETGLDVQVLSLRIEASLAAIRGLPVTAIHRRDPVVDVRSLISAPQLRPFIHVRSTRFTLP